MRLDVHVAFELDPGYAPAGHASGWAAEQVRKWAGEQVMTAYVGAWCSSLPSLRAAYCTTVVAQSA